MQAATTNATAHLRMQVLQMTLDDHLHVEEYLQRTKSLQDLDPVLQAAQVVGGARWVDDNTCQIRLELPASKIAAFLTAISSDPSRHPPILPNELKTDLASWKRIKVCAVGSSAGGEVIELARPHDGSGKWTGIGETSRKSAVNEARSDAIHQLLDGISSIVLVGDTQAKAALARPMIADRMNTWLQHQPVTRIEFSDDLDVTVTLAIAPHALAGAFRSAVQSDPVFVRDVPVEWDRVRLAIGALPVSVTGKASVTAAKPTTLASIVLPLQPPGWVDSQLQAEGSATGTGSRLKIGRAAEARAVADIRDQLLALHVDDKTTLADAARSDPSINQAIDRSLLQAHAYKAEYLSDGSVKVRVSLELRDAWEELRSGPR